jgi:hypothetical protein
MEVRSSQNFTEVVEHDELGNKGPDLPSILGSNGLQMREEHVLCILQDDLNSRSLTERVCIIETLANFLDPNWSKIGNKRISFCLPLISQCHISRAYPDPELLVMGEILEESMLLSPDLPSQDFIHGIFDNVWEHF